VPFGSVNPKLPGWREDLRRCAEDYAMPGIRLHPNYHGYELQDRAFADLLHEAVGRGLIVQLVASVEDIRTQHPLMRVPPVELSPLAQLLKSEPKARIVLLNWWPSLRGKTLQPFVEAGAVWFDISTVEGIEGIARLVERIPAERVLFGSNFPLFYFEAALLKVQESGLGEDRKSAVFQGSAKRMLRAEAR
jgi:hypothetical protein